MSNPKRSFVTRDSKSVVTLEPWGAGWVVNEYYVTNPGQLLHVIDPSDVDVEIKEGGSKC